MEEAEYGNVMEPTANGICYDFCRGACPRKGTCPWTHNLVEIAWNTAKQPLLDSEKVKICRKVLNVIKNSCPQHIADLAINRMIAQPSLRVKILSLDFSEMNTSCPPRPGVMLSSTTSPESLAFRNHAVYTYNTKQDGSQRLLGLRGMDWMERSQDSEDRALAYQRYQGSMGYRRL